MKSRIYVGQVRHRRFSPKYNEFNYRLYMMYLDLDELPDLFDRFWLWSNRGFNFGWFKRADHLGDNNKSLVDAVREKIFEHSGVKSEGPIRLLTHCRYLGFGFNPVSFYYCFDKQDSKIEHIVAEVNNTPWGEQYCYVLSEADNVHPEKTGTQLKQYRPSKDFHVSPFMPMNIDYDWRFNAPGDRLTVHMQNYIDEEKLFDATIDFKCRPITSWNMSRVLLQYPIVTVKVVIGIYYEALKLWLKRIPLFDHPSSCKTPARRGSYE